MTTARPEAVLPSRWCSVGAYASHRSRIAFETEIPSHSRVIAREGGSRSGRPDTRRTPLMRQVSRPLASLLGYRCATPPTSQNSLKVGHGAAFIVA